MTDSDDVSALRDKIAELETSLFGAQLFLAVVVTELAAQNVINDRADRFASIAATLVKSTGIEGADSLRAQAETLDEMVKNMLVGTRVELAR